MKTQVVHRGGTTGMAGALSDAGAGGQGAAATGGIGLGGSASGGMAGAMSGNGGVASGGIYISTGGQASGGALPGGTGGQSTSWDGGIPTCPILSQTKSSRSAHSSGFSGDYSTDYTNLYTVVCKTVADCATACEKVGGTAQSCAYSECSPYETTNRCMPPTYWHGFDVLRVEASTVESSAVMVMVNIPYKDQLVANAFQFEIPANATIMGIEMKINRAADISEEIADYEVKLVRSGNSVGLDRAGTKHWPTTFEYASYGNETDLWGSTWTPVDVNSPTFGVALTPMYLLAGGNGRAYVDFISGTVYYSLPCL